MKKCLVVFSLLLISAISLAGKYADEANENPFHDGELNPKYEGEVTALGGVVIKEVEVNNNRVYLLNIGTPNIKNIWVTSFIKPEGKKTVEVGDNVIFKGYISRASSLDPEGGLNTAIKAETLLMAIYVLNNGV